MTNLTGVHDPYEVHANADMVIDTTNEDAGLSVKRVIIIYIRKINP